MIGHKVILLVCLSVVAMVCCSCGNDSAPSTPFAKEAAPPEQSKMAQQGAGGVKARAGGGVAGLPEDAKPGEKVGAPSSGSKAGGG
jgi:hypothetical protein